MSARESHIVRRTRERYGIILTVADISRLQIEIEDGRSTLVRRDSTGEHRMVRHGETVLMVVWHLRDHRIITVLPASNGLKHSPRNKQRMGAGKNRFGGSRGKRSPRPRYEPEIDAGEGAE